MRENQREDLSVKARRHTELLGEGGCKKECLKCM